MAKRSHLPVTVLGLRPMAIPLRRNRRTTIPMSATTMATWTHCSRVISEPERLLMMASPTIGSTGKGKGVQGSDPYVTGTGTMSGGDPYGGNHGGSSTALYSMSNSLAPGYTTGSNLSPSDGGEDVHDYDLQRAISESRADRFESVRLGESSNANAHYADSRYGPRYGQASAQTGGYGGMDATPRVAMAQLPSIGEDPSQYTDPLMQLYRVAGHSQAARNYLRPDLSDPADPRFMVYHSSAFIPGHVFKIWWAEPRGQVSPYSRAPTGRETVKNSSGDFHVGYRRFLIISTDESHHSNCVPILTYEGRACCKPGVRPSKHGIIHAEGTKPRLRRGEPQLGFRPVPLRIYAEGETLAAESRVNYSKFRSIEHNLKVFFIGQVPEKYLRVASDAVDRCWADTQKHS
ncbi:hypothetical protein F5Y17DRAFT_473229 [Xylariaceae sp. FL0594]|nr:hypothetical protein F5Y17DRAFT_473229 [Xylariaceae sp. FL0594]